jgi:hypothetical protein
MNLNGKMRPKEWGRGYKGECRGGEFKYDIFAIL